MRIEAFLLPGDVKGDSLQNRAVAVFDVLRATTTITAALAAGVSEIHIFESTEAARNAAAALKDSPPILCGEQNCLAPDGFHLGNSPGGFRSEAHKGRTIFMATTNGTRAILAARGAKFIFPAALVNASAVASALIETGLDITLLCAGTNGEIAPEDLIGAGAVLSAIRRKSPVEASGDAVTQVTQTFQSARVDLLSALTKTAGGRNIVRVGLDADIAFAAQLDSIAVVGRVLDHPLRVVC